MWYFKCIHKSKKRTIVNVLNAKIDANHMLKIPLKLNKNSYIIENTKLPVRRIFKQ